MRAIIALLAALAACSPIPRTTFEPRCDTPEERAAAAKFVVDCATAANPKSDEEGEDLVAQCEQTATRLLCSRKTAHQICRDGVCRDVKP